MHINMVLAKRSFIIIVPIVLAAYLFFVTADVIASPNYQSTIYTVSGRITDQSNTPILGVRVELLDPNTDDPIATDETDSQGQYSVSAMGEIHSLRVTPPLASGFRNLLTGNLDISALQYAFNIVLEPLPSSVITISGYVRDGEGNGIPRVDVSFMNGGNARTDGDGRYVIQREPGGIAVIWECWNCRGSNFLLSGVGGYEFELTEDTELDFNLPLYRVNLHVQDPDGHPVANAAVTTDRPGNFFAVETIFGSLFRVGFSSVDAGLTTNAAGDVSVYLFPSTSQTYTFFVTPPIGRNLIEVSIPEVNIEGNQSQLVVLPYDHIPPVTTISLAPLPIEGEVYAGPVTTTLASTATVGFTIDGTYYRVDGGDQQLYTAPFVISGDGLHTIEYWSIDNAGAYETPQTRSFQISSVGYTPVGSNVSVQPIDSTTGMTPVTLIFSQITQSGTSSLITLPPGPPPPNGFKLGNPPTYYELTTSASFAGSIQVCIDYSAITVGNESRLKLFHLDHPNWVDVTSLGYPDTTNNIICGTVTSLSPFAILEPENQPPTVQLGMQYSVAEGSVTSLTAIGSDPEGNILTYSWDLDNDGLFETLGQNVVFSAVNLDGPSNHPVAVQVLDSEGLAAIGHTSVEVLNVAPTVNAGADQTVYRNSIVSLSGSWFDPAGHNDDLYTWSWTLGGANQIGSGNYGIVAPGSTSFAQEGLYTLTLQVTDRDGSIGADTVVIDVRNQPPVCTTAFASTDLLWPAQHQMIPVSILGITDYEGDSTNITITSIWQDEPTNGLGDGDTSPDGEGIGTSIAILRAERAGEGNGRIYHISFSANDGHTGSCMGVVTVGVRRDQGRKGEAVDDGSLYDSIQP
ncbi:MAG: carboxypeptidase regulatory-like domain-containing protein [Chloroflexi bacterium]|nr:carboxypeptidase regulatory-like domain-containing protein [Chloroflexota bacterium]